jgi:hypothetical protein
VTGTTFTAGPGYAGKLLEILREAVPSISNVGVLADPVIQQLLLAREICKPRQLH